MYAVGVVDLDRCDYVGRLAPTGYSLCVLAGANIAYSLFVFLCVLAGANIA